jgi:hypothetical protein
MSDRTIPLWVVPRPTTFRLRIPLDFRYEFSGLWLEKVGRDSSVGIATGCVRAGGPRVWSPGGVINFLFSRSSRLALRSTQPSIQWVPGALSSGVKRPGGAAHHSPSTSAEVKKMWVYTSTPHAPSWRSVCLLKQRDNFTFLWLEENISGNSDIPILPLSTRNAFCVHCGRTSCESEIMRYKKILIKSHFMRKVPNKASAPLSQFCKNHLCFKTCLNLCYVFRNASLA